MRSRDERHAVGLEQRARPVGVEPAVVRSRSASSTTRRAPPRGRSRRARARVPRGLPQPVGALGGEPERARGRLGIREASRPDSRRSSSVAGVPSALITTASTGLSDPRSLTAWQIAAATSSAPATTGGTKRTISASSRRVGEQRRDRRLVGLRRSPSRACRPGSRGSPRRAGPARAAPRLLARLRQLEPGRLAGVGAEDPEPAGVRQHADAAAARQRLAREQRGRVEQLLERVARAARRPGGRARRPRRPSRRARPCASSAAFAPARVVPAFSARIGLRRATRRASRRTCAGCRTTRGRAARARSSSSSSHHSSRSFEETSALFPIETKAEKPRPPLGRRLEQREPERAALGREADRARRQRPRGAKVALRPSGGIAMPRQFGPTRRRAVRAHEREQLLLPLGALGAGLGEAGGDDAQRAGRRARAPPRPRRARARPAGR